jgi:hypothetical protein
MREKTKEENENKIKNVELKTEITNNLHEFIGYDSDALKDKIDNFIHEFP